MSKITNAENTNTAVAKAPSKKSLAQKIFDAKLAEKLEGKFASNKDFRAATMGAFQTELEVSQASAATLYNALKIAAEQAGTVTLGRDPKKEKAPSTGVRGRKPGSKNKTTTTVVVDTTAETTESATTEPAVADATA